ncbi:MAG: hypothetical protein WA542_07410, partial [Candidatus Acidiferrum sp.]
ARLGPRLLAQFSRWNRDHFAVPPDVQRQSLANVLFNDSLHRGPHCQFGALQQRQLEAVWRWVNQGLP